jgi:hypothetical protein
VARMVGAGLVAHEAGVRLGGALGARVVHHLAFLTRPTQRFPRLFIGVPIFRRLVFYSALRHRFLPSRVVCTEAGPATDTGEPTNPPVIPEAEAQPRLSGTCGGTELAADPGSVRSRFSAAAPAGMTGRKLELFRPR